MGVNSDKTIKTDDNSNLALNIKNGVATSHTPATGSTAGVMNFNTDGTTIGVVSNKVTGKYKATSPLNMSSSA